MPYPFIFFREKESLNHLLPFRGSAMNRQLECKKVRPLYDPALFIPLSTLVGEQCPCESGHCGKDTEGMYAPATWRVTYLNEDAYGDDDEELDLFVCDTCINIYAGKAKTGTKTIVRVAPLQS